MKFEEALIEAFDAKTEKFFKSIPTKKIYRIIIKDENVIRVCEMRGKSEKEGTGISPLIFGSVLLIAVQNGRSWV